MKIVAISDTHGQHDQVKIPPCDLLIHAGDCTDDIGQAALRRFLIWFESQPATHKILVAGNHDGAFEKWPDMAKTLVKQLSPSTHYLEDSGCEIEGIKFWGSPWTPEFCNWFFNAKRGPALKAHWDLIPRDTDVVITHGPMKGILSISGFGDEEVGCKDLYEAILEIEPQVHICGHIHHSYGHVRLVGDTGNKTECYNASVVNERYYVCNKPHEFEIAT